MDLVENKAETLPTAQEMDLDASEVSSLIYHDIFDYPLSLGELMKWRAGKKLTINNEELTIKSRNGFYFFKGRDGIILKRLLRERISAKKFEIARKAGQILRLIPTIKMVAVTGALAMGNAEGESDIDLMIISKSGTLWTTRLITLLFLDLLGIPRRKYGDRNQKDKLCLNIWLDETSLTWPKKNRNSYTAHEICQTRPLVNKDKTYDRFIYENLWVKEFWPNAIKIDRKRGEKQKSGLLMNVFYLFSSVIEPLAFRLQMFYMRKKITKERVGKKSALFHPTDWWAVLKTKLTSMDLGL